MEPAIVMQNAQVIILSQTKQLVKTVVTLVQKVPLVLVAGKEAVAKNAQQVMIPQYKIRQIVALAVPLVGRLRPTVNPVARLAVNVSHHNAKQVQRLVMQPGQDLP